MYTHVLCISMSDCAPQLQPAASDGSYHASCDRLRRNCSHHNLTIQPGMTPKHRACFFETIISQLIFKYGQNTLDSSQNVQEVMNALWDGGKQRAVAMLREKLVNHMRETVAGNWIDYVEELQNPAKWVGDQLLMSCASYLGEILQVVTSVPHQSPEQSTQFYPNRNSSKCPLHVGYVHGFHYESLKPMGKYIRVQPS